MATSSFETLCYRCKAGILTSGTCRTQPATCPSSACINAVRRQENAGQIASPGASAPHGVHKTSPQVRVATFGMVPGACAFIPANCGTCAHVCCRVPGSHGAARRPRPAVPGVAGGAHEDHHTARTSSGGEQPEQPGGVREVGAHAPQRHRESPLTAAVHVVHDTCGPRVSCSPTQLP